MKRIFPLLIFTMLGIAHGASQGPNSAGTGANDATAGTTVWVLPGNITSSDDTDATVVLGPAGDTQYLAGSNFSFSIPTNSTIDGIIVYFERSGEGASGACEDVAVRLIKAGTIQSTDKSGVGSWGTSQSTVTYGGASDLWSGTWTPSDINNSSFGAAIRGVNNGSGVTCHADWMGIEVYYTTFSLETKIFGGTIHGGTIK